MQTQITCRGFECTEAMASAIHEQIAKIEKMRHKISRCEVTVGVSHRHRAQGRIFHVQVLVQLPNSTIVVNREPERDPAHEVFYVALKDAFQAAKKRLNAQTLGKRENKRRTKAAMKHLATAS